MIDSKEVSSIIAKETSVVQYELGVSEDLAHALLVKNKWSRIAILLTKYEDNEREHLSR